MEDSLLMKKMIRRLDVLISIGLDGLGGPEGMRVADKISWLKERGLQAAEIADIVGKPLNYVTSTLSQRKKIKARKAKPCPTPN